MKQYLKRVGPFFTVATLVAVLACPALAQDRQAPAATAPAPAAAPAAPLPPTDAASPAATAAVATAISADPATLPRDLSPWGMFLTANPVVKAVLIGLLFASIVTWTVWLAKSIELMTMKRKMRRALAALGKARSTADAERQAAEDSPATDLVRAAIAELRMSEDMLAEGIKERVASRLERIEAAAGRRIARGTGLLATIGATAPFVGLFGTVWGIMNSFIGISKAQTTTLAVVAPGIAEALLATALGLVAAIPAVVIYNGFARSIAGYRALLADASAEILRLVGRDLDQRGLPFVKAAE